jgi:hypothetical protein
MQWENFNVRTPTPILWHSAPAEKVRGFKWLSITAIAQAMPAVTKWASAATLRESAISGRRKAIHAI